MYIRTLIIIMYVKFKSKICFFIITFVEFDYEAVASQLKKKLNQLTKLNYDAMMGSLIAEDVITDEERKKIAKETGAGKMTYLILDVIIPSLKLKNCKKYRGFLMAMEDSEDGDLVSMAKKLGKSIYVPLQFNKCTLSKVFDH